MSRRSGFATGFMLGNSVGETVGEKKGKAIGKAKGILKGKAEGWKEGHLRGMEEGMIHVGAKYYNANNAIVDLKAKTIKLFNDKESDLFKDEFEKITGVTGEKLSNLFWSPEKLANKVQYQFTHLQIPDKTRYNTFHYPTDKKGNLFSVIKHNNNPNLLFVRNYYRNPQIAQIPVALFEHKYISWDEFGTQNFLTPSGRLFLPD